MAVDERLESAMLDGIKIDVADIIHMSESYEELVQSLKLYFELTPEFYEKWEAFIKVNKKHNPELHENKPKEYLVTVDMDYVDGHLRMGHLEALLSEKELDELDSLEDKDDKAEFLSYIADIVVDDYEVDGYGDLMWETLTVEEVKTK